MIPSSSAATTKERSSAPGNRSKSRNCSTSRKTTPPRLERWSKRTPKVAGNSSPWNSRFTEESASTPIARRPRRERVPLLATAFQGLAALALGISALWVCDRLLGRLNADDDATELEETLILSVAGESDLFDGRRGSRIAADIRAVAGPRASTTAGRRHWSVREA